MPLYTDGGGAYSVLVIVDGYHRLTISADHVVEAILKAPNLLALEASETVTFKPIPNAGKPLFMTHD